MKALIDTCVIIDVLQRREPFFNSSYSVFIAAANERFEAFITAKQVADIYYLIHRSTHNDAEARKILDTVFRLFCVLDTSGTDCKKAVLSPVSDYEDAILAETAERNGIDYIVTRNTKDFFRSSVKACVPDDLLELLKA